MNGRDEDIAECYQAIQDRLAMLYQYSAEATSPEAIALYEREIAELESQTGSMLR